MDGAAAPFDWMSLFCYGDRVLWVVIYCYLLSPIIDVLQVNQSWIKAVILCALNPSLVCQQAFGMILMDSSTRKPILLSSQVSEPADLLSASLINKLFHSERPSVLIGCEQFSLARSDWFNT